MCYLRHHIMLGINGINIAVAKGQFIRGRGVLCDHRSHHKYQTEHTQREVHPYASHGNHDSQLKYPLITLAVIGRHFLPPFGGFWTQKGRLT
jgi:hypothetical protein